jgi:hypothetical protein
MHTKLMRRKGTGLFGYYEIRLRADAAHFRSCVIFETLFVIAP